MGSNELLLRMGVDSSGVAAGAEEAVEQVKSAQQDLSASTARAAQEDADHLALVEAQYGQLGPAAAKAYGQVEAASEAAGQAERAVAQRKAEDDAAREARQKRLLQAAVGLAEAEAHAENSAREAAAAVAEFGARAEKGGKGAERAAGQAAVAIERLTKEIAELRAAGGNVEALEAQLRDLNRQMERNVQTAGKMRKALADAKDEFKASTARAGELEGQIGSLEGILNVMGASTLGGVASKAVALQGAFLITAAAAKQVFEILDALTKQAAAAWEESLSRQDAAMRAASGETGQYAANLRNVLAKNGYDVAAASLGELMKMEEEFVGRLRARGAETEKLQAQIRGDQKSLQDDTAVTIAALKSLGEEELNNTALAGRALSVVRELVERYKTLGEEAPEALKEWSVALERIAGQHEDLISILDRVLGAIGVRGPAAIDKQIDALREYAGEVERSGDVTSDQAALILNSIEQIRRAIELLPEGQREAAEGMLDALEELEERYRGIAKVALATFGIQTPEAIGRSIEKIGGLIDAFGPLGKVTAEQAAVVVAELQKILDAISVLPAEQRAAMKDQETAIRALADQYGEIAVRRKQYADDIIAAEEKQLAREKEILEERQELLSTFASVFDQLQAKLASRAGGEDVAEDVTKLKQELAGLEDLDFLSAEQLERMTTLRAQLAGASQATFEFGEGQKKAALSVGEVDDALVGLIDSIKGVEGGFANLPLASRAAIENMIGRLQQTAQEGNATKDVLNDAFVSVGRIIDEAGGSMGDLGTAINRANEDTLNLRREFGELEAGISGAADATGKLGEAQKDASTLAKERAEAAVKAAREETEAVNVAKEAHAGVVGFLEKEVDLSARLLVIWKELKECMASASF